MDKRRVQRRLTHDVREHVDEQHERRNNSTKSQGLSPRRLKPKRFSQARPLSGLRALRSPPLTSFMRHHDTHQNRLLTKRKHGKDWKFLGRIGHGIAQGCAISHLDMGNRRCDRTLRGRKRVKIMGVRLGLLGLLLWGLGACAEGNTEVQPAENGSTEVVPGKYNFVPQPSPDCVGVENGTSCDDGNPCTLDDVCEDTYCVGGAKNPCDTDELCSYGVCNPAEGCIFKPVIDGTECDLPCFGWASCQEGVCLEDSDTALACPAPPDDNPCVVALACDPETDACTAEVYAETGQSCDTDGDLCTVEACNDGGSCALIETVSCEEESADKPCSTLACEPTTGSCEVTGFAGNEVSCDDGNACTEDDTCNDVDGVHTCQGTALSVDDGNPCTEDSCVDGEVINTPIDGGPCETGDACMEVGECNAGVCEFEGCACLTDEDCPASDNMCVGELFVIHRATPRNASPKKEPRRMSTGSNVLHRRV